VSGGSGDGEQFGELGDGVGAGGVPGHQVGLLAGGQLHIPPPTLPTHAAFRGRGGDRDRPAMEKLWRAEISFCPRT